MLATGTNCMYARSMGGRFRSLPWAIRLVHAESEWRVLVGRATVKRGRSLLSRLAGWVFRFPPPLTAAPCRVEFRGTRAGERWWRRFGGHPMTSVLSFEEGKLYESFGLLKCELDCDRRGLALVIRCRRAWLLGVPLPAWLVPQVIASEKERDGKFMFRVHIRLPIAGLIAAYRGTLDAA
ncbi:MAG TPA: DUF4166 domain-containing protein [Burkholderiales bacterium]|jgi:hypothetical protein|nr:DUF4166 domain-containing protein [Burkholderiales bacterium]